VAKKNPALFAEIMWATAQSLQTIGIVLWPVMPTKMEALLASLGCTLDFSTDLISELIAQPWKNRFMITKIDALFAKPAQSFETHPGAPQDEKVSSNPIHGEENLNSSSRTTIDIEDFAKVELTVGTIVTCEEIPASDKLYKLQVNFGAVGVRQILSGIRKAFVPDELVGKQAVFVTNLKPRKMMGLESQGMLLTAQTPDKGLALVSPSNNVENGTRLK
jgi:methionyl-tRNA synthetase